MFINLGTLDIYNHKILEIIKFFIYNNNNICSINILFINIFFFYSSITITIIFLHFMFYP